MAFVELENVTKAYDSGWAAPVKALDRVSFTAEAGSGSRSWVRRDRARPRC
jgi:ABC-type Na+ transport system ATPase subunit NatA